jgi:hypothetical protein
MRTNHSPISGNIEYADCAQLRDRGVVDISPEDRRYLCPILFLCGVPRLRLPEEKESVVSISIRSVCKQSLMLLWVGGCLSGRRHALYWR